MNVTSLKSFLFPSFRLSPFSMHTQAADILFRFVGRFEYVNHKNTLAFTTAWAFCPLIFDIATSIAISLSSSSWIRQPAYLYVKEDGTHTGKRCFIKPHVENEIYIPFMISLLLTFSTFKVQLSHSQTPTLPSFVHLHMIWILLCYC